MDTELLRTFLEVERTRHFARAAQNLFVTQAAVSARISQLERLIGQPLFTRSRNNIQLTMAGHQLLPSAESILATWSRALMETAFSEERRLLIMGCLPSLREIYLDEWLPRLLAPPHKWLLQMESLNTLEMVRRLRENSMGIGMLYEPPRAAELWAEQLTSFDLVLVSTLPDTTLEATLPGYIYLDWGASFAVSHNTQVAAVAVPQLKLDSPVLAKRLLLRHGGSAFLASPMIGDDVAAGRLHIVAEAPAFSRTVYLIGGRETRNDAVIEELRLALHGLCGD